MNNTINTQLCKGIRTDEVSLNSDGHNASAKEEIQDFPTSSLQSTSPFQPRTRPSESIPKVTPSNQGTSTKPLLYQLSPRRRNSYYRQTSRRSWTDSRETQQNAARREYELLLANPRQANHFITLKYFEEYTAEEIRTTWSRLKALLVQQSIIAFSVIEITTFPCIQSDGRRWDCPINKVHYHILVDSDLAERQLRNIFNSSCINVGLSKEDFEVQYESIPDRQRFEHKAKYILKFDNFKEQAILFRPGTGVHKTCSIGRWFINADGSKMNKDKKWESIVAGWYPKKIAPKQP